MQNWSIVPRIIDSDRWLRRPNIDTGRDAWTERQPLINEPEF